MYPLFFSCGYFIKLDSFREVLANQSVRVFVCTAFSRTARMSKGKLDASVDGEAFMLTHLFTLVTDVSFGEFFLNGTHDLCVHTTNFRYCRAL